MSTISGFSPEPEVQLTKAFAQPFKNFVSTARTCYSSKGIIDIDELSKRDQEIARSIYQAGHHTTLQHAHFQFALSNVSRFFIWSFLHSHPFYNSEQVSQRYVAVRPESYAIPPLQGEALNIYLQTVQRQTAAYERLCERLLGVTETQYKELFPHRPLDSKRAHQDIKKKAQEVARYTLPIATLAYLYHTVSGITLLRYWRMCQQWDVPLEQHCIVGKMVQQLLSFDPDFALILEEPLEPEEIPEVEFFRSLERGWSVSRAARFVQEFDADLDGRISKLVDWKINNEGILAQSVREVLGLTRARLSDDEAVRLVLDPSKNRIFGESLNLTTLSKLNRALVHAHYSFRKKLSHTADSQDQRHRMTPASRPILAAHLCDQPDYITPALINQDPAVEEEYRAIMDYSWEQIDRLIRAGSPPEFALYLLPNAVAVRFTESGDLLNLHHKYTMRLCYNAQEEIWRACLDEVQQIREINPTIGRYLLPPCTLREMAQMRPICPEGDRYCGVRVWKLDIADYSRVI